MNDSVNAGTSEYIPNEVFVVGGVEDGSVDTCLGDSGDGDLLIYFDNPVLIQALP